MQHLACATSSFTAFAASALSCLQRSLIAARHRRASSSVAQISTYLSFTPATCPRDDAKAGCETGVGPRECRQLWWGERRAAR